MTISFKEDIQPYIEKLEEIIGLSFKVFLATTVIVAMLGVYIANLLYGNHSLQVLQNLRAKNQFLQSEILVLKKENATLHKKFLEWTDAK